MYALAKKVLRPPYRAVRWPYDHLHHWLRFHVLGGTPILGHRSLSEKLAWNVFATTVRASSQVRPRYRAIDPDFAARGFMQGLLPEEATRRLIDALRGASPRPMVQEDYVEGYAFHPELKNHERDLNRDMTFLHLGPAQLEVIEPVIKSLRDPLAKGFGSPWRVINVRSWITHSRAGDRGPNAWHTDGLPLPVWKVMIYLTGVGPLTGTTEVQFDDGSTRCIEGPPGTWMLFKPSELKHRGIPPKNRDDRYLLELIVIPSFWNDQRALCAGTNAHYPSMPWFRPTFAQLKRAGVLDPVEPEQIQNGNPISQ